MRFTVTKVADLDEDLAGKVMEEFGEWLDERDLLNLSNSDPRTIQDLVKEYIQHRNSIVD